MKSATVKQNLYLAHWVTKKCFFIKIKNFIYRDMVQGDFLTYAIYGKICIT